SPVLAAVLQDLLSRALYPSRVMHMWFGLPLFPRLGKGVPAGIEQHEQGADMVFVGNTEILVYPVIKSFFILFMEQIVQVYAHGIHTYGFGPAEFPVYGFGVEGLFLPHFQLVDGGTRIKVGPYKPGLFFVPLIGLFLTP